MGDRSGLPKATTRRHRATVVGLGAMGRRHARVLAALADRFEVVGGYDLCEDGDALDGLTRLRSADEAVHRSELVIVATPIEAHAGLVAAALAAGRHVLVEKPLCETASDAHRLASSARAGAMLFVGHSERFNPVVRALGRLLRDEEIVSIDLHRAGPARPSAHGVLLNMGVHDLDLAVYLGGGSAVLRDATSVRTSDGAGEDCARVRLRTACGAAVQIYVDRTLAAKRRTITVVTRRSSFEGDLLRPRLVHRSHSEAATTDVPLVLEEPLAAQARALADALDGGGRREIATGLDGARAVVLAERASLRRAPSAVMAGAGGDRPSAGPPLRV